MDHKVNGQGHLVLGGADAVALAEKYGTPLYVMEEEVIRAAMRAYRQSVERFYDGKGLICYASKAFACKEMYRIAKAEGLGRTLSRAASSTPPEKPGFPMEKVVFHGNNKTPEELRMALDLGVGRIVVDNFEELETLSALAAENGVRPNIQLRIKPGIDAQHPQVHHDRADRLQIRLRPRNRRGDGSGQTGARLPFAEPGGGPLPHRFPDP